MNRIPYVSPDTPRGGLIKHDVMNIHQFGMYVTDLSEPQYSPIIRMETRLEGFVVGEELSFREDIPYFQVQDTITSCSEYLKREMLERLSTIGLLIPDSVRIEWRELHDFEDNYRHYRVTCHANALMPTSTGEKEPTRHYCAHCTCTAFEDQYHSGTCENCGAPFEDW